MKSLSWGIPLLVLALSGCNDSDQALKKIEPDWIHDPSPGEPTPTASPTPKESPSPTPTPSVSVTPSPNPSDVSDLYTGPAEVEKYVAKFIDDAKAQGLDVLPDMKNPKLVVQIKSLDSYGSSVIGLCETGYGLRRVTFDPDFWNSVSETQREILAHHEFGHCILYRPHRTALLSNGTYASVMYPIIMSSSNYLNQYDYYQEELFTWNAMVSSPAASSETETVHICQ